MRGPQEMSLIKSLLFDTGKLDAFWLVKDHVLSIKRVHPKFLALDDEHYDILVKCAACDYQLNYWMNRSESKEVRLWHVSVFLILL